MRFDDLLSRCPDDPHRAARRLDPYWAGMWDAGSNAVWMSYADSLRMAHAGVHRPTVRDRAWTPQKAYRAFVDGYHRQQRLNSLAGVGMWRTTTFEQLACLAGNPNLLIPESRDVEMLWATGLVQRGKFKTAGRASFPGLLRASNTTALDALTDVLPAADLWGVTAGQPWRWGTQHDRHNVLATELMLRIAEFLPVPAVFGEQLAQLWMLSDAVPHTSVRSADGLLVRSDGMRLAVELTATITSDLKTKIAKWVNVLEADRDGTLGVVFVEAPHPNNTKSLTRLRRIIAEQAGSTMARLARVPDRIFVVQWKDWFPGLHEVSAEFTALRALRPTGPVGDKWQPVELLDPFDVPLGDRASRKADVTAILPNIDLLLGVPHWLRTPQAHQRRHDVAERAVLRHNGLMRRSGA